MTIAVYVVTNMFVAAVGIILGYVLRILQEKENRRESDKEKYELKDFVMTWKKEVEENA